MPAPPGPGPRALGGLILGRGAMVAPGCTVGVLMSGVVAGAASGQVFPISCHAAAWLGGRLRLALGRLDQPGLA